MNHCTFRHSLLPGTSSWIFLAGLLLGSLAVGQAQKHLPDIPLKPETLDQSRPFDINNIFAYFSNNGVGSYNPFYWDWGGLEYPKGSRKIAVFADGFLWGGYHMGSPEPKIGGSHYRGGLQAGRIVAYGTSVASGVYIPNCVSDDPQRQKYRVYRVRPDAHPGSTLAGELLTDLTEEAALVSRFESATTPQSLYDNYLRDWSEWPARSATEPDGMAPFHDLDGNGIYDPALDVPGQPGAGLTLYYVANDANMSLTQNLGGTPPFGMEVHRTIWGYKRKDRLGDVLISSALLINKSGYPVDSMFLAQWSDFDIGDLVDDLAGCDTLLQLGYGYQRKPYDTQYGWDSPAAGYLFLQGPLVPGLPTESGRRLSGVRTGFKNLKMTSFTPGFIVQNYELSAAERSLNVGSEAIQWYRRFRGLLVQSGGPVLIPGTQTPTTFYFTGDPLEGTGWLDDSDTYWNRPVGGMDRSLLMGSGPFTMAAGDTQEIVTATLLARGADRLASVNELKTLAREIGDAFLDGFSRWPPETETEVSYTHDGRAVVSVRAKTMEGNVISASAALVIGAGMPITTFPLVDDGRHDDGIGGDGIFGGEATIPCQGSPLSIDLTFTRADQTLSVWSGAVKGITTAGMVILSAPEFFSESLGPDGALNPEENIRFGFTLHNTTRFTLEGARLTAQGKVYSLPSLPPGVSFTMEYDPDNIESYFDIESDTWLDQLPVLQLPAQVLDRAGNIWKLSFVIPKKELPWGPIAQRLVPNVFDSRLELLLIDPMQFTRHQYVMLGVDSIAPSGESGFTLIDSTTGKVLLQNHPLPDPIGHNVPVTDGFRIRRGFRFPKDPGRLTAISNPAGGPRQPWSDTLITDVLHIKEVRGTIGNARDNWPSGGVGYWRNRRVEVRFARTDSVGNIIFGVPLDTLVSYAYRYVFNANQPAARPEFAPLILNSASWFSYQDYTKSLPFAVYDVSVTPPRRLSVGYTENNVPLGTLNRTYWPPVASRQAGATGDNQGEEGPREWFLIFDRPYSETPDPALQVDCWTNPVPLMWVGYPGRRSIRPFSPPSGNPDVLLLDASRAINSEERWSFRIADSLLLPIGYVLEQNYPNPFNPATSIRYSLPVPSEVRITIYDILGRQIRQMVPGPQYAGTHILRWDGTNSGGSAVSTGVYFYRFEANSIADPTWSAIETKRMLLLR